MKWIKKGHEFDNMYKEILCKERFYLFGAGDYGRQFFKIFHEEIDICGYIDNDIDKQSDYIEGLPCRALRDVKLQDNEGIILTMSQMARVNPKEQLIQMEYVKDKNFFIIEEFISVFNVYKYNKVYFSSISFLPSTLCNLNCKYCLNFNPFAKKIYTREWKELVVDVDMFFKCVDRIMLFHVSGGEPMLYQYFVDIIEYIDKNYGDRIDTLRTVTNGTVVPSDEILQRLGKCNIEITVDDYREAVPQFNERFDKLIGKLEEYNIKYYINKANVWIDLAPEKTDYSDYTDKELEEHRKACSQSWQELRDGKLYNCNYAAYANVAGIAGEQDMEETFDLRDFDEEKKKEFIEFRLGFSTRGYTNFCKRCRGFTKYNSEEVKPAGQLG